MWLNTGNHYKCYDDTNGRVLGRVSESVDADGTYVAYCNGYIGDYITQQAAIDAVEKTILNADNY